MPDSQSSEPNAYNEEYYRSHCGPVPYKRDDYWLNFFGNVADTIVRSFAPRTAFDAGCAIGLLVECLWDRGVEAYGRDISTYALEQARPDIRPFLQLGTIADSIDKEYDFISCIEVLEHVEEADAKKAIAAIAASTSTVLFSSSPTDFAEPTHINVRPPLYWLELWADAGFAPSVTHDAGYLAPHAYILHRSEEGRTYRDLIAYADRIRHRVALSMLGTQRIALEQELVRAKTALQEKDAETEAKSKALARMREALKIEAIDLKRKLRSSEDNRSDLSQDLRALRGHQNHLEARIAEMQGKLDQATRDRDVHHAAYAAISNSTTWRSATRILSLPLVASPKTRRVIKGGVRVGWRLISFRLAGHRTAYRERLRLLHSSSYFDPEWYRTRYTDVADSGMAPEVHYARFGYLEGRAAHPDFNAELYLTRHPEAGSSPAEVFLSALRSNRFVDGIPQISLASDERPVLAARLVADHEDETLPVQTAHDIIERRFPDLTPLAVYASPGIKRRISVVTDSIGRESLYGGVGTALILAALTAKRIGAELRIVTRSEESSPEPLTALYAGSGISWDNNVEMLYSPKGFDVEGHSIPVCDKDYFITTSWWTTSATMRAVEKRKIIQLVQEDERMFYPYGDELLRCSEVFSTPETLKIVNSGLLLSHFQADGLFLDATSFEPSFPAGLYYNEQGIKRIEGGKKRFFFYARPHNLRNLYYRGLESLSACIERGILDPNEWDFYFAGHGTSAISLPRGAKSITPGVMTWPEYAAFIRSMDLGMSLMYTPHPSYPPLDLAASGAVVVTNKFGLKQSLDVYSENIICAEPDTEALVASVRLAVARTENPDLKNAYYERNKLSRDWTVSMEPALERIANWVGC